MKIAQYNDYPISWLSTLGSVAGSALGQTINNLEVVRRAGVFGTHYKRVADIILEGNFPNNTFVNVRAAESNMETLKIILREEGVHDVQQAISIPCDIKTARVIGGLRKSLALVFGKNTLPVTVLSQGKILDGGWLMAQEVNVVRAADPSPLGRLTSKTAIGGAIGAALFSSIENIYAVCHGDKNGFQAISDVMLDGMIGCVSGYVSAYAGAQFARLAVLALPGYGMLAGLAASVVVGCLVTVTLDQAKAACENAAFPMIG